MDKDRRVSIETISAQFDVSVGTVHTIIHEELMMRKICAKFVPRVLWEDQKEKRCIAGEHNGVHAFSKGINPKRNVIALLEFELANFDVAAQHVNHYVRVPPPQKKINGARNTLTAYSWKGS